jgi:hypothetical protein
VARFVEGPQNWIDLIPIVRHPGGLGSDDDSTFAYTGLDSAIDLSVVDLHRALGATLTRTPQSLGYTWAELNKIGRSRRYRRASSDPVDISGFADGGTQ